MPIVHIRAILSVLQYGPGLQAASKVLAETSSFCWLLSWTIQRSSPSPTLAITEGLLREKLDLKAIWLRAALMLLTLSDMASDGGLYAGVLQRDDQNIPIKLLTFIMVTAFKTFESGLPGREILSGSRTAIGTGKLLRQQRPQSFANFGRTTQPSLRARVHSSAA